MKKSNYCQVMKKDKQVIKYQRKAGITQEYFRSTPEPEVLDILNKYGINVPKVLEIYDDHFIEEYIDGDLLDDIYTDYGDLDKSVIDDIINDIIDLIKIDSKNLSKYTKWKNTKEFFLHQISNTIKVWKQYEKHYSKFYKLLGINKSILQRLKLLINRIDVDRPLCLIHGDRHKNNMIKKGNRMYFIDWELSCIGDLAYDAAFHIHQMKYSDKDLKYFLKNLEKKVPDKYKSVMTDIDTYLYFVTMRSVIYYVKILYECDYSEELVDKFYIRLQRLYEYTESGIKPVNKDEIREILMKEKRIA